ncbi:hypothetical protein VNO77_23497 [Canavalia gladiata]|uniref:Uncharacterized protein n=1 Tax=Canavalia gladiata TaxID=3824 RepID=A0AAN9L7W5_CANGL
MNRETQFGANNRWKYCSTKMGSKSQDSKKDTKKWYAISDDLGHKEDSVDKKGSRSSNGTEKQRQYASIGDDLGYKQDPAKQNGSKTNKGKR